MKKILITILLLTIIMAGFGFVVIKILALGPTDNSFNKNYRYKFAHYPLLRNILSLHDDGDARADYLGSNYKKITVNIYEMDGISINNYVLNQLTKEVQQATGKQAEFRLVNLAVPYMPSVNDKDISNIIDKYFINFNSGESAQINLLAANQKEGEDNLLGLTYKDNTAVIFNTPLMNFTKQFPDTFDNYELSTILHEFGHQLGLPHNQEPNCLMNPKAETNDLPGANDPNNVVIYFCNYEINLIKNMPY